MQAEQNDDDAGSRTERTAVRLYQLPEGRGPGAKTDEHRREAGDEEKRRCYDAPPHLGVDTIAVGKLLEGRAADIAQIRRHERKHAGRQEADEPRQRHAQIDMCIRKHRRLLGDCQALFDIGSRSGLSPYTIPEAEQAYLASAATPGNSRPSSHSRNAPPAVETYVN